MRRRVGCFAKLLVVGVRRYPGRKDSERRDKSEGRHSGASDPDHDLTSPSSISPRACTQATAKVMMSARPAQKGQVASESGLPRKLADAGDIAQRFDGDNEPEGQHQRHPYQRDPLRKRCRPLRTASPAQMAPRPARVPPEAPATRRDLRGSRAWFRIRAEDGQRDSQRQGCLFKEESKREDCRRYCEEKSARADGENFNPVDLRPHRRPGGESTEQQTTRRTPADQTRRYGHPIPQQPGDGHLKGIGLSKITLHSGAQIIQVKARQPIFAFASAMQELKSGGTDMRIPGVFIDIEARTEANQCCGGKTADENHEQQIDQA